MHLPSKYVTEALGLSILGGAASTILLGWVIAPVVGAGVFFTVLIVKDISDRRKDEAYGECDEAQKQWKAHWHRRLSHRKWKKRDI